MQKYMMFKDMKADKVMYPNGKLRTRNEVIEDYPIFATEYGVIGVNVDESGAVGNIARMFSYYDVVNFIEQFRENVEFSENMTNAQKCEAITAFVNQPRSE